MLAAGVITTLIGHLIDAGVMFSVVFINVIIGFIQEGKAEKAIKAIRTMLSSQATVLWDRLHHVSIEYARTVAVNTLVMFEIFYLLNTRFLKTPVLTKGGLTGDRLIYVAIVAVLSAQIVFTYVPFMQRLFDTRSISFLEWLLIIMVAFSVFVLVEIEKYILQKQKVKKKVIDELIRQI